MTENRANADRGIGRLTLDEVAEFLRLVAEAEDHRDLVRQRMTTRPALFAAATEADATCDYRAMLLVLREALADVD